MTLAAICEHLLELGALCRSGTFFVGKRDEGFEPRLVQKEVNFRSCVGRELFPLACSRVLTRKYPTADIDRGVYHDLNHVP